MTRLKLSVASDWLLNNILIFAGIYKQVYFIWTERKSANTKSHAIESTIFVILLHWLCLKQPTSTWSDYWEGWKKIPDIIFFKEKITPTPKEAYIYDLWIYFWHSGFVAVTFCFRILLLTDGVLQLGIIHMIRR